MMTVLLSRREREAAFHVGSGVKRTLFAGTAVAASHSGCLSLPRYVYPTGRQQQELLSLGHSMRSPFSALYSSSVLNLPHLFQSFAHDVFHVCCTRECGRGKRRAFTT